LPNGKEVVYYQEGLTPEEGKQQAASIAKFLPKLVNELGISDITRVLVKEPNTTRPNPFDTILPFIEAQRIMDVQLPSTTEQVKESGVGLFPDETSVVLCWDAEGLWSPKVDGKRTREPDSKSLLCYLNKAYQINNATIPGPPVKGSTIYVYRSKGKMEVFRLDDLDDFGTKPFRTMP
jgi:hypothetical protein